MWSNIGQFQKRVDCKFGVLVESLIDDNVHKDAYITPEKLPGITWRLLEVTGTFFDMRPFTLRTLYSI